MYLSTFITLLLIIISCYIFLCVYFIKIKSKIGILITILIGLSITLLLLTNKIDEHNLTEQDVVNDLQLVDISIKDNFKIIDNTVRGMPERFQNTEIQISNNDRNNIIDKIKHSNNFKLYRNNDDVKIDSFNTYNNSLDIIFNFKYPEFYSREVYLLIDKIPTRILVYVDSSNILKYSRYEK